MKIQFTTIEGRSFGYYAMLVILGILAAGGLYASYLMFEGGHYITGMTNQVPWGFPIVMAVYLIGLSAGSLVLSSLSSVFGKKEYKVFSRVAVYLAALLLMAGLMSITLDWGRPDRLMIPFTYFNFNSMFSWNAFLYSAYIGICVVYLMAMFAEKEKLVTFIGAVAVIWAVAVHSGTGAIFGFIHARELYHSPLLAPSFIAAALSSGTGLMILILLGTFKFTNRQLDNRLILGLAKLLSGFILIVLYFIFIENLTRYYAFGLREAEHYYLFEGLHSKVFWIGLILIGSIIPAAILFFPKTNKSISWIAIASFMVVIGVLAERYIIVIPAQTYPLHQFPGKEVSSVFLDGAYANYFISLPEAAQAVGIVAIIGIMFMLGLKLLELLPKEAVMHDTEKKGT
jgi:molybdopterin-containing oxidoreductase family membrane subunit